MPLYDQNGKLVFFAGCGSMSSLRLPSTLSATSQHFLTLEKRTVLDKGPLCAVFRSVMLRELNMLTIPGSGHSEDHYGETGAGVCSSLQRIFRR